MYGNKESVLATKSFEFSKRIIKMVDYLYNNADPKFSSLYQQVLRSGTSISANISESQFAQSRADFITKLHIAAKEANETKNWLYMLHDNGTLTPTQFKSMNADCSEILALLVASLKTAKRNEQNNK